MLSILQPKSHFQALRELVLLLTRHRELTLHLAKREITDRYLGQVFGSLWAIGHPLVLIGVYVFIFGFVLNLKVGDASRVPFDYTTYLLAGLIPWLSLVESMSKATVAITMNANLVKQIVFPVEVLPVKGVIASLITQAISIALLLIYVLAKYHGLPWTYALLPLLMLFQSLFMIGLFDRSLLQGLEGFGAGVLHRWGVYGSHLLPSLSGSGPFPAAALRQPHQLYCLVLSGCSLCGSHGACMGLDRLPDHERCPVLFRLPHFQEVEDHVW
jgi:hypothetical protein